MAIYLGGIKVSGSSSGGESGDMKNHQIVTREEYDSFCELSTVKIEEKFMELSAAQYKEIHKFVLDDTFTGITWTTTNLLDKYIETPVYLSSMTISGTTETYPDGIPYDGILALRYDSNEADQESDTVICQIYSEEDSQWLLVCDSDMGRSCASDMVSFPIKRGSQLRFYCAGSDSKRDSTKSLYIIVRLRYSPTYNS